MRAENEYNFKIEDRNEPSFYNDGGDSEKDVIVNDVVGLENDDKKPNDQYYDNSAVLAYQDLGGSVQDCGEDDDDDEEDVDGLVNMYNFNAENRRRERKQKGHGRKHHKKRRRTTRHRKHHRTTPLHRHTSASPRSSTILHSQTSVAS